MPEAGGFRHPDVSKGIDHVETKVPRKAECVSTSAEAEKGRQATCKPGTRQTHSHARLDRGSAGVVAVCDARPLLGETGGRIEKTVSTTQAAETRSAGRRKCPVGFFRGKASRWVTHTSETEKILKGAKRKEAGVSAGLLAHSGVLRGDGGVIAPSRPRAFSSCPSAA